MTQPTTKVLIATPTHSGDVTLEYLISVRGLEAVFRSIDIVSDLRMNIGTSISRQRNALASVVLNDESYTHLLFIDSDMSFTPSLIQKMLKLNQPVCGCLYPSKALNFNEIFKTAAAAGNPESTRNISTNYVAAQTLESRVVDGRFIEYRIQDGFIRTLEIGFGVVLINRSALMHMKAKFPELIVSSSVSRYYASMGDNFEILQCFETLLDDRAAYLSEDLSFCWRWTRGCDGEIWACVDETVGHVGRHRFEGRCIDKLLSRGTAAPVSGTP